MTIISEGPLCLKIHLNRLELQYYFKNYESINYKDPLVKQTVERLFALAAENFEFEQTGDITTELYPTGSGGCVFRFTCEPTPRPGEGKRTQTKYLKEQNTAYAFEFCSSEDLIRAVKAVAGALKGVPNQSSLYRCGPKYYLLLTLPRNCNRVTLTLQEFCSKSLPQSVLAPLLLEHFHCLIAGNAAERLNTAF